MSARERFFEWVPEEPFLFDKISEILKVDPIITNSDRVGSVFSWEVSGSSLFIIPSKRYAQVRSFKSELGLSVGGILWPLDSVTSYKQEEQGVCLTVRSNRFTKAIITRQGFVSYGTYKPRI